MGLEAITATGLWYATSARDSVSMYKTGMISRGLRAIGLIVTAIGLHALWNFHFINGWMKAAMMASVGGVGLCSLFVLMRKGRRAEFQALHSLNPYMQESLNHNDVSDETPKELVCDGCGMVSPQDTRYCARCGHALRM